MLGEKQSRPLKFVCSDMWRAYLKVIAKKAAGAVRVLDRFHIMQKMNQAIDQVRAAETKRLKADGHEPLLKHSRWCPLKRPDNLTEKQAVKLSELLQYNLRSHESTMHSADCRWYLRSPSNRETSGRRSGGVGDPRRASETRGAGGTLDHAKMPRITWPPSAPVSLASSPWNFTVN